MKSLRIFISSPGDVAEERDKERLATKSCANNLFSQT